MPGMFPLTDHIEHRCADLGQTIVPQETAPTHAQPKVIATLDGDLSGAHLRHAL